MSPTLGWKPRTWKIKSHCRACGRFVRAGMTNPYDMLDPPRSFLCHPCFHLLLDSPELFGELFDKGETAPVEATP